MTKKIYLVRHAENINNVLGGEGLYENNLPLTRKGEEQARAVGRTLSKQFDDCIIITSPYIRCRETSRLISTMVSCSRVIVDDRLKELQRGVWGDLKSKEVEERLRSLHVWEANPETFKFRVSGGESFIDLLSRAKDFISTLPDIENIVIVTHSGTIKALTSVLELKPLEVTLSVNTKNAEIHTYAVSDGGYERL